MVSDMVMSQTHEAELEDDEEEAEKVDEESKDLRPEDDQPDAQGEDEDADDVAMEERYNKLLKVFKVLPPDSVDELIKKREEKV